METVNDVWESLKSGASDVLDLRDRIRTRSAPSGSSDSRPYNPFPGTQGPYPQAESKPAPGDESGFSIPNWLWLAVAALAVLILLRR